jgi:predicted secreted protein
MNLVFGIAIYFICWWIILFAILPIGITTQEEAGDIVPGTTESAPSAPHLVPKLIATTIVTTIIFLFIYWLLEGDVINLDDIPFLPKFEKVSFLTT